MCLGGMLIGREMIAAMPIVINPEFIGNFVSILCSDENLFHTAFQWGIT